MPSSPRRRPNSRKPASKIVSMPWRVPPSWRDERRCSVARSVPDQNVASNSSDAFCASLSTRRFWKMIAHDASDASSSATSTSCTIRLAPRIS
jgi:hypothetical protein